MTFRQRLREVRHWLLLCLFAVCITSIYSLSIKNPVGNSYAMYRLGKVARIIHDVPYCSGDAEQTIDIYLPPESTDPARTHASYPLAIYVHGGGWSKGDKRNAIADFYGAALVRAGFAFASINYRLAPQHRYPVQNNDTACAINTLAAIAPQYAINTRKAILIGDSAGGFLVSTYALSTAKPPVTIRGVVSLYGTTDLVRQLKLGRRRNPNAFNYLGSADFATAKRPAHSTIKSPTRRRRSYSCMVPRTRSYHPTSRIYCMNVSLYGNRSAVSFAYRTLDTSLLARRI